MSNLSKQNKLIVVTLSLFLILIVGYAVFSESLNVGGTASASGEFNIIYNSVGTIKEAGSSGASASISQNKKILTISVPKLEYPSAYVEVPVVIKNTGSISAKLKGITTSGLTTTDIKVTYSGVSEGEVLNPNEERNMKIRVTWDSASTTVVDNLTFKVELNYEQASNGEVTMPTPEQSDLFTWDGPTIVSGLSDKGIAEVKANGGHLVIPEGVTEIADASINPETGEVNFDKGFSPFAIGKLDINTATEEQILQNSIITSVTFPSTIRRVGNGAFFRNETLVGNLALPNGLLEIGAYAFAGTSIDGTLNLPPSLTVIGDISFSSTKISGELVIPDNVTRIGMLAFSGDLITSLKLGEGLKSVGVQAFAYCTYVVGELVIPNNVVSIEDYAFQQLSISSLKIGSKVETISDNAFVDCNELTGDLYIPDSVKTIGSSSFSVSSTSNKLTSISISRATTYQSNSFTGRPNPTYRN